MARLPAANPLSSCISAPQSAGPSRPDLYSGRVGRGRERFARGPCSRLLINLAGCLAGGQRVLRPILGLTLWRIQGSARGMGQPPPSWGNESAKYTELNAEGRGDRNPRVEASRPRPQCHPASLAARRGPGPGRQPPGSAAPLRAQAAGGSRS